jgi:type IV pilus assembly protein PilV
MPARPCLRRHDTHAAHFAPHPGFGFTLIEVLVAVVVLSVGLLGIAALQLKGLQSAHAAYQRTVATIIARDAVERLWVARAAGAAIDAGAVQSGWLAHWRTSDITLPALDGAITRVGSSYRIAVTWADRRLDDATTLRFEYVAELLPDK